MLVVVSVRGGRKQLCGRGGQRVGNGQFVCRLGVVNLCFYSGSGFLAM